MPPHFFELSNSLNATSPSSSSSSIYHSYNNISNTNNNNNTNNISITNTNTVNNITNQTTNFINTEENLTDLNSVLSTEDLIPISMENTYAFDGILNEHTFGDLDKLNPSPNYTDLQFSTNLPQFQINHPSTSNGSLSLNEIKREPYIRNDEDTMSSFSCSGESNVLPAIKTMINPRNGKIIVERQYGPITVRPRRNPAPTLANGRRSRNARLPAEEEAKRETRRKRNRLAAEKCKLKRAKVENELEINLKHLQDEAKSLQMEEKKFLEQKQKLLDLYNIHIELNACLTRRTATSNEQTISNNVYSNSTNAFTNSYEFVNVQNNNNTNNNNDFSAYTYQTTNMYNSNTTLNLQQQQQATSQMTIPNYQATTVQQYNMYENNQW